MQMLHAQSLVHLCLTPSGAILTQNEIPGHQRGILSQSVSEKSGEIEEIPLIHMMISE